MFSEKQIRNFFHDSAQSYGFVCSQKELNIKSLKIDIFAVDKSHNPFIIEFKKSKNKHIVGQSAQYLALAPSSKEDISRKLNFFNINWENLKVLLIAPDFDGRDYDAANYKPLKGKVHFFRYEVIPDYREEKVFALKLSYQGEKSKCPIRLPVKNLGKVDFSTSHQQFLSINNSKSKRQYYASTILPALEEASEQLSQLFESENLYPHISYFGQNDFYLLRLGTAKKQTHRASVSVSFSADGTINFGFDLTHSIEEGKILSKEFQNNLKFYAKKVSKFQDYCLFIPNTGIPYTLPIGGMEVRGIELLLSGYNPKVMKDCYIRITRNHEGTLTQKVLVENLCIEVKNFEFLLKTLHI
jgi:hypothetical protein